MIFAHLSVEPKKTVSLEWSSRLESSSDYHCSPICRRMCADSINQHEFFFSLKFDCLNVRCVYYSSRNIWLKGSMHAQSAPQNYSGPYHALVFIELMTNITQSTVSPFIRENHLNFIGFNLTEYVPTSRALFQESCPWIVGDLCRFND